MMNEEWMNYILSWSSDNLMSIAWSLVMLFFYLLVTRVTLPKIEEKAVQSNFKSENSQKAAHIMRLVTGIVTISIILIIWGVDFSGLLLVSTSLLTLTGVALFASWSLLSNVTCYFLMLFHTSFRRGNFIRVLDADNYIEGYISEVGLFNTKLVTEEREIVVYPNNLILNRPTIINPRNRWKTVGKVADKSEVVAVAKDEEGVK